MIPLGLHHAWNGGLSLRFAHLRRVQLFMGLPQGHHAAARLALAVLWLPPRLAAQHGRRVRLVLSLNAPNNAPSFFVSHPRPRSSVWFGSYAVAKSSILTLQGNPGGEATFATLMAAGTLDSTSSEALSLNPP